MEQILIYSDSLSWGIIPNTRKRLPHIKRWPGVFEKKLNSINYKVRVIENCLNGRRTVWGDPFNEGRNASNDLAQAIEINSPLNIVILMLGTNDFQCTHENNAWLSAQGTAKLINIIKQAPIEPEMPTPKILVIAPPKITEPKGYISNKFKNAEKRCVNLAKELEIISKQNSVYYFNSSSIVEASEVDGIHLDERQHKILGEAVAEFVSNENLLTQT